MRSRATSGRTSRSSPSGCATSPSSRDSPIPPRRWAPSPSCGRASSTRSGGATPEPRTASARPVRGGRSGTPRRPRSCPRRRGRQPVVFEAADVLALLRAGKIAREMKLRAQYVGAGDEYRMRDEVAQAKPDLILRVDFARPYKYEADEWERVPLERLRRIDRAPSNPKWLREAGLSFSITTHGLDEPEDLPKRLREAMSRGLSSEEVARRAHDRAGPAARPHRAAGHDRGRQDREPRRRDGRAVRRGEPRLRDLDRRTAHGAPGEKRSASKDTPRRRRPRPLRRPTRAPFRAARTPRSRRLPPSSCATRRSGRRGRPKVLEGADLVVVGRQDRRGRQGARGAGRRARDRRAAASTSRRA